MGALDMDQQHRDWVRDQAGAAAGNPYATLCAVCFGRHAPPRNEHCPHQPLATTAQPERSSE